MGRCVGYLDGYLNQMQVLVQFQSAQSKHALISVRYSSLLNPHILEVFDFRSHQNLYQ